MNKLSQDIMDQLRALQPRLEAEMGIIHLRVFGSVARGEAREDSDVDLIADFDGRHLGWSYFSLPDDISQMLGGRKVDVCEEKSIHRLLKERILREAQNVY